MSWASMGGWEGFEAYFWQLLWRHMCFMSCFPCFSLFLAVTADNEKILVFRLLDHYTSVSGRPVANATDPVDLSVGLSLIRLEGLDQDAQTLSMKVYLKMVSQAHRKRHVLHSLLFNVASLFIMSRVWITSI